MGQALSMTTQGPVKDPLAVTMRTHGVDRQRLGLLVKGKLGVRREGRDSLCGG